MMSPDLQRIKHIRDYCIAIGDTVGRYGDSFEIYSADPDYQRSIAFSLLQIGELSGSLSEEFKRETSDRMPWRQIKGMRNLFAHSYGTMDHSMIWETIRGDVPEMLRFCNEQLSG